MDDVLSPIRFNCPACHQPLSAPRELLGREISCPGCRREVTVISLGKSPGSSQKSFVPQAIALVAFLAIAGGAAWWLRKGGDDLPAGMGGNAPTQAGLGAEGLPHDPSSNETGVPFPSIKRSGAGNWEVAEPYYEHAGASTVQISTQIKKGTLCFLPGALIVDQVADGLMLATHRATREQWILRPDNPRVLDEIAISEGAGLAILAGIYTGPEQVEMASGAPRRLPSMHVLCIESTVGYLNFEHPAAPRASVADLKRFQDAHEKQTNRLEASEREELNRRTAEQEAQRAKDIAELENDPSWNPNAKKGSEAPPKDGKEREVPGSPAEGSADGENTNEGSMTREAPQDEDKPESGDKPVSVDKQVTEDKPESVDKGELAGAKADLAAVNSRIESERKRFSDALQLINSETKNKTVPVKEGSPAYHRCMEASRIIKEVETGAAELKAEKARLETLVSELEKAD